MNKLHPSAFSLQPLAFLLLALAGFWTAPRVLAQPNANPPERLTYQGFLADGTGTALATNAPKNYDVVFRLWDAQTGGTNAIWAEQQTVTVDKGYFSVLLGEGTQVTSPATEPHGALSTLFTNATASDRYVEMTVKGIGAGGADVKILPRLRLLTAPYAFLATSATKLVSGSGGDVISSPSPGVVTINGTVNASGGLTGLTAGQIPNLDANKITSGTLADARLSGYVALLNAAQTFAAAPTFNAGLKFSSSIQSVGGNARGGNTVDLQTERSGLNSAVASGPYSVIGGGAGNTASGYAATAPGGYFNTAAGDFSFAAGANAKANHAGSFVWADWQAADFASTAANQFLIRAAGGVGIGTATPTQAKLVVNGAAAGVSLNSLYLYNDDPAIPHGSYSYYGGDYNADIPIANFKTTPRSYNLSIYASSDIAANGFATFSDARIKRIAGRSNAARDLSTLAGIEVTDYNYVDTLAKGTGQQKKVIAQQVEEVFPQAVSKSTDTVPDIYQKAEVKDGWVKLATNLKKGERVRLIGEKKEGIHEVLEVAVGRFRTEFKPEGDQVFVYGREVKDFRTVDYDAISMLNVSATQELARRLEKLEARELHLTELERKAERVATLEQEVAELKKLVAQLAKAGKGAEQAADAPVQKTITTASLER